MMFLAFMVGLRDNLKFACYPIVIANIIFALMLLILSQILIIYALVYSGDQYIQIAHLVKYGILAISLLSNIFYRVKYAKHDIEREESTESKL